MKINYQEEREKGKKIKTMVCINLKQMSIMVRRAMLGKIPYIQKDIRMTYD